MRWYDKGPDKNHNMTSINTNIQKHARIWVCVCVPCIGWEIRISAIVQEHQFRVTFEICVRKNVVNAHLTLGARIYTHSTLYTHTLYELPHTTGVYRTGTELLLTRYVWLERIFSQFIHIIFRPNEWEKSFFFIRLVCCLFLCRDFGTFSEHFSDKKQSIYGTKMSLIARSVCRTLGQVNFLFHFFLNNIMCAVPPPPNQFIRNLDTQRLYKQLRWINWGYAMTHIYKYCAVILHLFEKNSLIFIMQCELNIFFCVCMCLCALP